MNYATKLQENGLTDYEIYELEMDSENAFDDLSPREKKCANWYDILCDLAYARYNVVL